MNELLLFYKYINKMVEYNQNRRDLVYSKIFYEYKNKIGSSLQISSLHLIIDFLPSKIKIDKQKRNKDKQRSNKPNNRKI
jgi:hypothetical protein